VADTLALSDLNGDGLPDIIAAVAYPHSIGIQVLLGKGGTSFQTPEIYPVANFAPGPFAVGDVNGDNIPDLVVASENLGGVAKISVFLGDGDGTFQPEKDVVASNTGSIVSMASGDLNGDGRLDLAFTTNQASQPALMIALGNGDGTFSTPVSYASGGSDSIAIGDMNGDGYPDIVSSGISILFGDGTGAFPNRRDYVQQTAGNIVLTDFDGDGKTDIVIGTGALWVLSGTAVAVMYGRGDGTFSGAPVSVVPGSAPGNLVTTIESADFDGDGIPDVLSSDLKNITALHGDGAGNFKMKWQYSPRTQSDIPSSFASSIATGDFNRDGIPDFAAIIASSAESVIEVFLGIGDGTFQPPLLIQQGVSLSDYSSIVAGDFNGDGKLDLALAATPNYAGNSVTSDILIYLGNGNGTFAAPLMEMTASGILTIGVGDFNNDGLPDLAVTTNAYPTNGISSVGLLLGVGDGTFEAGGSVPAAVNSGQYTLVIGDFNLDGNLDLAVGALTVFLGSGDGTFQPPVLYSAYSSVSSNLIAADLNADGIPDLVTASGYLLGNGDGSFQSPISLALVPFAAADFNGDGQTDLAGSSALGVAAMLNISQPTAFALVSSASLQAGPVAPESLVSGFGCGFSSITAAAAPGSSSIQLAETSVTVRDALGMVRSAPLLLVSQNQVNFELPAGTSPGPATVVVTNAAGSPPTVFSSGVAVAPVTPAVFELNKAGLAAAYAVRVSGGVQTIEPIFTVQNGNAVATPINLGPPADQVYLSLFGTGLRNAPAGQVFVRINGVNAPVEYAGPQLEYPGLDQVNILLTRQLAGAGQAGIVLTAAGHTANTTYVFFQ
jgi:uncharacterized protein (TIGR03437 family)